MRELAKMGMLVSLTKTAITTEEHARGMAQHEAKALELAKLRGVNIPTKDVRLNPRSSIPVYEGQPDLSNVRMTGKTPGPNPLKESEVIKAHNPYAASSLSRIKHRWINPVKRFMHTTPGKAVGIGALGAAGLGLYGYLKGRRTPQPEDYQLSPEEQLQMQQQMYSKMGAAYNNVTIPRPASVPQITSPGPAVSNLPQIKRPSPAASAVKNDWTKGPKEGFGTKGSLMVKEKKANVDPAIAAMAAGGVGGIGGYLTGSKLIAPWMEGKENAIIKEIAQKQNSMGNWRSARRYTPIALAALGAVTLAAIAASKARNDERSKIQEQLAGHLRDYDPTHAGFGAADQVPMGSSYERTYD